VVAPGPSSLHSTVAAPDALKVKLGPLLVVAPLGPPVIAASGGVASTLKLRTAGVASVNAGSLARTRRVKAPSVRPV
jgi:hypothetical protein